MPVESKTETLDLRLSSSQKELVRQAANLRGQTMTEFVISIVLPAASDLVERDNEIRLSQVAWSDFVRMVSEETPATPLARREAQEFLKRFPREADPEVR